MGGKPRHSVPGARLPWHYAKLGQRRWSWDADRHTEYTALTTAVGLSYTVDDFWDTHGAGFQGYDQFLASGPLHRHMPADIAQAIHRAILFARAPGGAGLAVTARAGARVAALRNLFLSIDSVSVAATDRIDLAARVHILYQGDLPKGDHALRWAVAFAPAEADAVLMAYGSCVVSLAPGKRHTVELETTAAPPGLRATMAGAPLAVAGQDITPAYWLTPR